LQAKKMAANSLEGVSYFSGLGMAAEAVSKHWETHEARHEELEE
jgi:hypothetical protein